MKPLTYALLLAAVITSSQAKDLSDSCYIGNATCPEGEMVDPRVCGCRPRMAIAEADPETLPPKFYDTQEAIEAYATGWNDGIQRKSRLIMQRQPSLEEAMRLCERHYRRVDSIYGMACSGACYSYDEGFKEPCAKVQARQTEYDLEFVTGTVPK